MILKKNVIIPVLLLICTTSFSQIIKDNTMYIQNKTFNSGESYEKKDLFHILIGSNILPENQSGDVILKSGSSLKLELGGFNIGLDINPNICIENGAEFELMEYFPYPTGTTRSMYGDGGNHVLAMYYGKKHEGLSLFRELAFCGSTYQSINDEANIALRMNYSIINSKTGNVNLGDLVYDPVCKLCVSGDFQGSRFLTTSDVRLKSKIKPLHNCNNKLLRLSGKTYNKKIDGKNESKEIGLIAQDVTDVLPDVVSKDQSGFLSVDYLSLVPLIIEAIKEQQETIDDNQKKLDEISF